MEISQILEQIISKCQLYNAQTVILFGSRAKGTHTRHSDFDIAVNGVTDIAGLQEALDDIPTLYKIDLVDLDNCRNDLLLEDIAIYGRKIYEKI
ncbi:MAG: nucleotidyltransferase domain-containing protein [Lachnospiraceae bacterium]|nr:nucleotidyltransferase domain-containing protein [Lachnospiraceae bacterium]MBQ8233911.1 nucleotidyltransferase domain-containing protein [Lachnospiraceae bacterium]